MGVGLKREKIKGEDQGLAPGVLMVKDLALSHLWLGFHPWPKTSCVPNVQVPHQKKKKKKERKKAWAREHPAVRSGSWETEKE